MDCRHGRYLWAARGQSSGMKSCQEQQRQEAGRQWNGRYFSWLVIGLVMRTANSRFCYIWLGGIGVAMGSYPHLWMTAPLPERAGRLGLLSDGSLFAVKHGAAAGLAGVGVHAHALEHGRGFVLTVGARHGCGGFQCDRIALASRVASLDPDSLAFRACNCRSGTRGGLTRSKSQGSDAEEQGADELCFHGMYLVCRFGRCSAFTASNTIRVANPWKSQERHFPSQNPLRCPHPSARS